MTSALIKVLVYYPNFCMHELPNDIENCLKNGADPNLIIAQYGYDNLNGIQILCYKYINNIKYRKILYDCIVLFIKYGIDINYVSPNGNNILIDMCSLAQVPQNLEHLVGYATQYREYEPFIVGTIISDSPIYAYPIDGEPLRTHNLYEINVIYFMVSLLIDNGININHQNNESYTALMLLCKRKNTESIVELILNNGYNLSLTCRGKLIHELKIKKTYKKILRAKYEDQFQMVLK